MTLRVQTLSGAKIQFFFDMCSSFEIIWDLEVWVFYCMNELVNCEFFFERKLLFYYCEEFVHDFTFTTKFNELTDIHPIFVVF